MVKRRYKIILSFSAPPSYEQFMAGIQVQLFYWNLKGREFLIKSRGILFLYLQNYALQDSNQ